MLDEVEAHLAVVQAAVDVCGLGIDEARRLDGFGETREQPHGSGGRRPLRARELAGFMWSVARASRPA